MDYAKNEMKRRIAEIDDVLNSVAALDPKKTKTSLPSQKILELPLTVRFFSTEMLITWIDTSIGSGAP